MTATVSAATDVFMASTLATQVKGSDMQTTQAGAGEAATTSAPTSGSSSAASSAATTTSAADDIFHVTDEVYVFPPAYTTPWEITWYSELHCEGDYYHMEGYNEDYITGAEGCLNLRGGLNSLLTETNVTCRWWTNGGLTWSDCDSGTMEAPQSWVVKNGRCMVFNGQGCDCFDHYALSYVPLGCHNRTPRDTPKFMSFECRLESED
jgi:hypothetical protein